MRELLAGFELKDADALPRLAAHAQNLWLSRCREFVPDAGRAGAQWEPYPDVWDPPFQVLSLWSIAQRKVLFVDQVPPELRCSTVSGYLKESHRVEPDGTWTPIDVLQLHAPLSSRLLDELMELIELWMRPETSPQDMALRIADYEDEGFPEDPPASILFPDFDCEPGSFERARALWNRMMAEAAGAKRGSWSEWREPHELGNPMLCLHRPERERGLRIVQRHHYGGVPVFDAWLDEVDYARFGGPAKMLELTISVILSEATVRRARPFLTAWLGSDDTARAVEQLRGELEAPAS